MKVTFNDKIRSLLKEYNRGVLNMQTQNQHGDTLDPEDDTYDGSVAKYQKMLTRKIKDLQQ